MQDTGSGPCPLLSESGTFRENPEMGGVERRKVRILWAIHWGEEEEQTIANPNKGLQSSLFLQNKV